MSIITITETAAKHIDALLSKNDKAVGVRLGTSTKGCNGLAYDVEYVEEINSDDEIVSDNGATVYIDRKSLLFLMGLEMDWEESMFATGFKFTNPNETGRCGCGESFTVDETAP